VQAVLNKRRDMSEESSHFDLKLPRTARDIHTQCPATVCRNKGQADLLTNFACSNAARGFTFERILTFCTNQETCDIAEGLGMAAFYANKVRAISFG
jgi:hypothetical protein